MQIIIFNRKRNDITMKWDTGFWQILINMEAQSQSDYTMTFENFIV